MMDQLPNTTELTPEEKAKVISSLFSTFFSNNGSHGDITIFFENEEPNIKEIQVANLSLITGVEVNKWTVDVPLTLWTEYIRPSASVTLVAKVDAYLEEKSRTEIEG